MTLGTVAGIPDSLFGSGRTLAIHMYALLSEGLYMEQAYSTAVILLIMVVVINLISSFISKKLTKGKAYYYKVIAFSVNDGGKAVRSASSAVKGIVIKK